MYSKCPEILYTHFSDKMSYTNITDPDQTVPLALHYLLFYQIFCETKALKNIDAKNVIAPDKALFFFQPKSTYIFLISP